MYFLDNDSGVSTMPSVGNVVSTTPRWFTESPPSYPGAAWFNIIQAELINAIQSCGIELDKSRLDQLADAFATKLDKSLVGSGDGQIPDMSFFARGSGWQKLPSGLIIQWLDGYANASGVLIANLPIRFPNAILFGVVCEGSATAWQTDSTTTWGFDSTNSNAIQIAAFTRKLTATSIFPAAAHGKVLAIGY